MDLGAGQKAFKGTCLLYCNKLHHTLNSASASFIGRREECFLNIFLLIPGWFNPKTFDTIIFTKLEPESMRRQGQIQQSQVFLSGSMTPPHALFPTDSPMRPLPPQFLLIKLQVFCTHDKPLQEANSQPAHLEHRQRAAAVWHPVKQRHYWSHWAYLLCSALQKAPFTDINKCK